MNLRLGKAAYIASLPVIQGARTRTNSPRVKLGATTSTDTDVIPAPSSAALSSVSVWLAVTTGSILTSIGGGAADFLGWVMPKVPSFRDIGRG